MTAVNRRIVFCHFAEPCPERYQGARARLFLCLTSPYCPKHKAPEGEKSFSAESPPPITSNIRRYAGHTPQPRAPTRLPCVIRRGNFRQQPKTSCMIRRGRLRPAYEAPLCKRELAVAGNAGAQIPPTPRTTLCCVLLPAVTRSTPYFSFLFSATMQPAFRETG